MAVRRLSMISFLFAPSSGILLPFARNDFTQHDHTVAIHESDAGQTFAILEGVAHEGLLRLERALGHLVRLQGMWFFHFFTAGFFPHLPRQLRDATSRPATTHETNRRVTNLDLVRDVQNLNLSSKLPRLTKR